MAVAMGLGMMRFWVAFFSILPSSTGTTAPSDDAGKSYHLYHKLGDGSNFVLRGYINISLEDKGDNGLVASYHPSSTFELDTAAFDSMVEQNSLYTLAVADDGEDKPPPSSSHYVSASVPGCSLRRSNLREEIGLTIGPTGKILSIYYRPIISPFAKTCHKLMPLSGRKGEHGEQVGASALQFKTTVSFDAHNPMTSIPTVLPPQKPPPGLKWYRRNAKNNPSPLLGGSKLEGGGIPGVDDEEPTGFKASFLYRYWYVILPVALMSLFGGVDEEELVKQRQAAGGASAAVAATGVAHAQTKQRRGKRD